MKKVFLYVVIVIAFSCEEKEQIPEDILSKDQMVDMLIDFRIAEGKVATMTLGKDSSQVIFKELERRILEDHNIDSSIYVKSHNYYLLHPKQYLSITDIVIDSLKVRQQELTTSRRFSN